LEGLVPFHDSRVDAARNRATSREDHARKSD
jgi:hypothetical protein